MAHSTPTSEKFHSPLKSHPVFQCPRDYRSPAILDLCYRAGKSRDYHDVIVFEMFPSTRKLKPRKASVFKFLRFKERFRKAPFSWRIIVDGNLNRKNKAAFLNSSGVSWTRPVMYDVYRQKISQGRGRGGEWGGGGGRGEVSTRVYILTWNMQPVQKKYYTFRLAITMHFVTILDCQNLFNLAFSCFFFFKCVECSLSFGYTPN